MIGKILLTLAVIAAVVIAVRVFGSLSKGVRAQPKQIEREDRDADDLSWDETSKTYRPRDDRDPDKN
ncbi:MAG: hypothetical protein AAF414_14590 [Pseudomonadota bacterium]